MQILKKLLVANRNKQVNGKNKLYFLSANAETLDCYCGVS